VAVLQQAVERAKGGQEVIGAGRRRAAGARPPRSRSLRVALALVEAARCGSRRTRAARAEMLPPSAAEWVELTADQRRVGWTLEAAPAGFQPYLLHGVTGSGKTEVHSAPPSACSRRVAA
jgi:primosomal protein N' (replication factor Y)